MVTEKTNTKRSRTYARNRATAVSRKGREKLFESDSTYFLKLVIYAILGTLWLKFAHPMAIGGMPLNGVPIGLLIGVIVVHQYETYQADRKIWYAILLVITIVSYFVPAGIVI